MWRAPLRQPWVNAVWVEHLEAPGQRGDVLGGEGALAALADRLARHELGREGLAVVDEAVGPRALAWMAERDGLCVSRLLVTGGERLKDWTMISSIYESALRAGVARDGWLLAVGGGALSDAVGFAAATYLRGIPWAAVPTTLLAQVDAAIGGKTGINLPAGKNLVGAFHLPRIVGLDPRWTQTLPPREWRAGLGELLKTALLMGVAEWNTLEAAPRPWEGSPAPMLAWAEQAARFKCQLVARDPHEQGDRILLNLGHTVGHAVEQVADYRGPSHGEAVGLGLLAALRLSEELLGLDAVWRMRLRRVLERWGMPVRLPPRSAAALVAALARDKKRRGGEVRWVLLRHPGEAVVRPVPGALVATALAELEEGAAPDGGASEGETGDGGD
jgi:3-dehydroquinate synthetase